MAPAVPSIAVTEVPVSAPPPASAARPKWLIATCLASVYIVWGTTYFALKVGVQGSPPFFLVGTRFVVAGALVIAWLKMRGGHALPTPRQWGNSAILGFLMLAVGLSGVAIAERTVSSGAAVALISFMPLMMAVWAGLLEKWPKRSEWFAIALGTLGTLVMVTGADLRASPGGTGLILLGTVTWSLGTLLSRRIDVPHGAMGFAAEMLTGGLLALVLSVLFGERWALPESSGVWWAWAYLVVFGSLIAFSAYRWLVERVSPTLASTYAYVNPPVALFVGWLLGNETFSPNVFLGLPIVLAAVGLHTWSQLRATPPKTGTNAAEQASQ